MKPRGFALAVTAALLLAAPPFHADTGPVSNQSIYQLGGAWTTDAGQPFDLARLRGQPVVLAMIYTQCGSACPLIVHAMQGIEQTLAPATRTQTLFVLVSFDTHADTPQVLHTYRKSTRLDDQWILLHGEAGDVRKLAMVLGMSYTQVAPGVFSHSTLITLLNRQGEIALQRSDIHAASVDFPKALAAGP